MRNKLRRVRPQKRLSAKAQAGAPVPRRVPRRRKPATAGKPKVEQLKVKVKQREPKATQPEVKAIQQEVGYGD